jgi:hypothetical protein
MGLFDRALSGLAKDAERIAPEPAEIALAIDRMDFALEDCSRQGSASRTHLAA